MPSIRLFHHKPDLVSVFRQPFAFVQTPPWRDDEPTVGLCFPVWVGATYSSGIGSGIYSLLFSKKLAVPKIFATLEVSQATGKPGHPVLPTGSPAAGEDPARLGGMSAKPDIVLLKASSPPRCRADPCAVR